MLSSAPSPEITPCPYNHQMPNAQLAHCAWLGGGPAPVRTVIQLLQVSKTPVLIIPVQLPLYNLEGLRTSSESITEIIAAANDLQFYN